tara:strand:+ start:948 stop:1163 length:216 start_codon:yes stop_codon:yes gene_type:complete
MNLFQTHDLSFLQLSGQLSTSASEPSLGKTDEEEEEQRKKKGKGMTHDHDDDDDDEQQNQKVSLLIYVTYL